MRSDQAGASKRAVGNVRAIKAHPAKPRGGARPAPVAVPAASVTGERLAAAAWAEADVALAIAWRDARAATREIEAAARASNRIDAVKARLSQKLNNAAAETLSVTQALNRAARLRGLELFGDEKGVQEFDPSQHETSARAAAAGAPVRVVRQGVRRRVGGQHLVIVRALVRAVRPGA